MLLNKRGIKRFLKDRNKRINKEGLSALEMKLELMLARSVALCGHFATITACEVNHAGR